MAAPAGAADSAAKAAAPPRASKGFLRSLFFADLLPVIRCARDGNVKADSHLPLPDGCGAAELSDMFWAIHRPGQPAARTIWRLLRADFCKVVFAGMCGSLAKMCGMLSVRALTQYLLDGGELQEGLIYAGLLCTFCAVESLAVPKANLLISRGCIKIANIFASVVYSKAKKLHPFVRHKHPRGDLVNLALNDLSRLADSAFLFAVGIAAPFQLFMCVVLAVVLLGPEALVMLFWIIILASAVIMLGRRQGLYVRRKMELQGKRLAVINEMLPSMKVVKLSAWEEHFERLVMASRASEERALMAFRSYQAAFNPTGMALVPFTCLSLILLYLLLHGELPSIPDTFALIHILRTMTVPLTLVGPVSGAIFQLLASCTRLNKLLAEPGFDRSRVLQVADAHDGASHATCIELARSSYEWQPGETVLRNVSLSVRPGQLIFVVGHLGQGKSSLLQALLGEMERIDTSNGDQEPKTAPGESAALAQASGGARCRISCEKLGYAPQQPFVLNSTVRENIIFGAPVDEALLKTAISCSGLGPDLEMLPAGDNTEIGEKGITLSGGQRARVALARVAYSKPRVALLDDPFSALDMEVGRHVFEQFVCGALAGSTRIIVSSQIHMVDDPRVDRIIVMNDGEVVENGTFAELTQQGSTMSQLLRFSGTSAERNAEVKPEAIGAAKDAFKAVPSKSRSGGAAVGRVTADETKAEGSIKRNTLLTYCRFIGPWRCAGHLMLIACFNVGELSPDLWMSVWREDLFDKSRGYYLSIWVVIIALALGVTFLCRINGAFVTSRAATRIHNTVFQSTLRLPMSFFEKTPTGRILNRFGQDQFTIDSLLGIVFEANIIIVGKTAITCIVVMTSAPWVAFFILLVIPLVWRVLGQLRPVMVEVFRYSMVTKSPAFNSMEETLTGLPVIRASGMENRFTERFHSAVNGNQVWLYTKGYAAAWGEQRLMLLATGLVCATSVGVVFLRDEVLPSVAAISLVYVSVLGEVVRFFVSTFTQAESGLGTIERAQELLDEKPEASRETAEDAKTAQPPRGLSVEFQNVSVRYQAHLDLALRGVTFTAKAGERIGIVGRSGSGKSTMLVALVRLVELCGGRVMLGEHDASKLGLRRLRTLVTVIPQEPVMFSGTVRWNLDPTGTFPEKALEDACEDNGLREMRKSFSLDEVVKEGGINFSPGERQLLCMARALLRNNPVMLFDEATASMDVENDARLQSVLRSKFQGCTILTVAHRIGTVADYDRIMAMSAGQVAEFDAPSALLKRGGIFASLAREAGIDAILEPGADAALRPSVQECNVDSTPGQMTI